MKVQIRLSILGMALTLILLTACNFPNPIAQKPTPTAAPTAVPNPPTPEVSLQDNTAQCVAGTWEIQDMASFLNANLKTQIPQAQDIQFKDTQGHLRYTFDQAGSVSAAADNFRVNMTAKIGPLNVNGYVALKGSGSGAYTVNNVARTLEITNLQSNGFTVSAFVAGTQVLSDTPVDNLIWFGSGNNQVAVSLAYTCTGNQLSLTYTSSDASIGTQTINLIRSEQ
jgi:hypothetical protein